MSDPYRPRARFLVALEVDIGGRRSPRNKVTILRKYARSLGIDHSTLDGPAAERWTCWRCKVTELNHNKRGR